MIPMPLWLVALVFAGAAPFLVGWVAQHLERRHRARTRARLGAILGGEGHVPPSSPTSRDG